MPNTINIPGILCRMMALTTSANLQQYTAAGELEGLHRIFQQQMEDRRAHFELERRCLAHEVNNALTGILSCAEVLGTHELDDEEKHEFLGVIGKEIERVVKMSQEFAESVCEPASLSRMEAITVSDFMQELSPLIKAYLARHRICFQQNLHYTGLMQAHVGQLKQVFLNLIYNACEAMPAGETFQLSSRVIWEHNRSCSPQRREPLIEFSIADTGCGMSEDVQARMFDPYVTSGKVAGTGLGLATVKKILDAHQARISVKSCVGQGTTIQVLFPCIQ